MTEIDPIIELLRSYYDGKERTDELIADNPLMDELYALFPNPKARPLITRLVNIIHTYVWAGPEDWLKHGRQPPSDIRVTTLEQLRKTKHYGAACENMLRVWAQSYGMTL